MSVKVSVVMPVYNVETFIEEAVHSVLAQSWTDFELLVVDDCSPDQSVDLCRRIQDDRIKIIHNDKNRGLAGTRNTGIRHARADYIAFLDADDTWHPDKLAKHVEHLDRRPEVGISFSRSRFMEPDGQLTQYYQMPRLVDIDAAHCLCRNPVGNGSAAVVRRSALEAIRYQDDRYGELEDRYFDEDLRRSEDIECWTRIMVQSGCVMEGIPEALTNYRLNAGGLSAQTHQQYASWETALEKIRAIAPDLVAGCEHMARAYQLRYLSRQSIRMKDGRTAVYFTHRALATHLPILWAEPKRTVCTLAAAYLLFVMPKPVYEGIEGLAHAVIGATQQASIAKEVK